MRFLFTMLAGLSLLSSATALAGAATTMLGTTTVYENGAFVLKTTPAATELASAKLEYVNGMFTLVPGKPEQVLTSTTTYDQGMFKIVPASDTTLAH